MTTKGTELAPVAKVERGLTQRFEPKVLSKAEPEVDWLLQARADINSDKALQAILREGKETGRDPVDKLAAGLNAKWEGNRWFEAREVAQYLWDEFTQIGQGLHLISSETGKIVVTLDENDIYQPAMVPREGGGMVKPLPRIRPDLEGLIYTWTFEKSREQEIVQALAAQGHQTALLREEGDPRLLVASRRGRKQIVAALAQLDPQRLLRACGGTSAAFLNHFDLGAEDPESGGLELLEGTAASSSTLGIQDMRATNLHHNRAGSLQGALVQGWVREVARQLSVAAHRRVPGMAGLPLDDFCKDDLDGCQFWVSPPDTLKHVRRVDPTTTVMPVVGAQLIGLKGKVGAIVVPKEFTVSSHELFDRWETHSALEVRLWIDWSKVTVLALRNVALDGYVV